MTTVNVPMSMEFAYLIVWRSFQLRVTFEWKVAIKFGLLWKNVSWHEINLFMFEAVFNSHDPRSYSSFLMVIVNRL